MGTATIRRRTAQRGHCRTEPSLVRGWAAVDRKAGRVDFYDARSRRTGWGELDESGKVERFDLKGRRQGETAGPLAPAERERWHPQPEITATA